MSYTDERDEIAELFGVKPSDRNKGYTEEFDQAGAAAPTPHAVPAPVAAEAPAPLPLPEIKKPVKLRPPAHVEPHPHDPQDLLLHPAHIDHALFDPHHLLLHPGCGCGWLRLAVGGCGWLRLGCGWC